MHNLASAVELRLFLELDETELPDDRAELILSVVSGLVRDEAHQLFDQVETDEVVLDGTGTDVILLPQLPVADVASVEENGTALVDGTDYDWSTNGVLRRLNGSWVRRARYYTVVYSHGYANPPDGLKGIVLRVAARVVDNPEGLVQEAIGGYSAGYRFDPAALNDADKRALDPYRP